MKKAAVSPAGDGKKKTRKVPITVGGVETVVAKASACLQMIEASAKSMRKGKIESLEFDGANGGEAAVGFLKKFATNLTKAVASKSLD